MEMSDDFLEWMMYRENAPLASTGLEQYILHNSPEGGTDTIGYGHKLSYQEEATQSVNGTALELLIEEDCERILACDVASAMNQVESTTDLLDQRRMEMLTDFVFNLGSLDSFPKFVEAVIEDDVDTQRKEYKRYYTNVDGKVFPLAERNAAFYARYLSE